MRGVIEKIPARTDDSMLMMAYQMNSDVIEDNYLIPSYKEYRESLENIRSYVGVDRKLLALAGAKWFLLVGARGAVFQEMLFCQAPEFRFLNRLQAMLPLEQRGDLSIVGNRSGKARADVRALSKRIVGEIPESARPLRRGIAVLTVDFGANTVTYEDKDGVNVELPEERSAALLSEAMDCSGAMLPTVKAWRKSIRNAQGIMADVLKKQDARGSLSFDLADL